MTPFDLIELTKKARSVEELITLARDKKIKLSTEDATIYYDRWHGTGELSDDDLDMVSGGVEEHGAEQFICEFCGSDNLLIDVSEGGFYCYNCKKYCRGQKI